MSTRTIPTQTGTLVLKGAYTHLVQVGRFTYCGIRIGTDQMLRTSGGRGYEIDCPACIAEMERRTR